MITRAKLNSSGFSLVEVLLASGLMIMAGLAALQMNRSVQDGARLGEAIADIGNLSNAVRETLRFKSSCATAIVGANTTGFNSSQILSPNGKDIVLAIPGINADQAPGDDVLKGNESVRKLNIQSVKLVNAVDVTGGGTDFAAQIQMIASDKMSGIALKPAILGTIFFKVDAGGAIISCENPDVEVVPLCTEMGCTWDPTASPQCKCASVDLTCPPQQFVTGIDSSGNPVCTPLGPYNCAPNEYLREVGIGSALCAPLPPPYVAPAPAPAPVPAAPVNCAANTINYSGTPCAVSLGTGTAVTTYSAVPNVTGGYTGQTDATCNADGSWSFANSICNSVCPAGTSIGGPGGAAGGGCSCNNAGETWNGAACVPPAPSGPGGACSCTGPCGGGTAFCMCTLNLATSTSCTPDGTGTTSDGFMCGYNGTDPGCP